MREPHSRAGSAGPRAAAAAQGYAALWFVGAVAGCGAFDRLTSVLLILTTFLFGVVARYSRRYLAGDPGQARFTLWLCLTGTFVFALVLATNLLLFAAAWCGISLSLHHLLEFYKDRPSGVLAARKKFLVSRVGDLALAVAVALTYAVFGTGDLGRLSAAAEELRLAREGHATASIPWICCLFVFAALLKSAQFPFHSWLPDTMETPTPVSALMHAGIINAGGILVIRLSGLISLSSAAMWMLCLAGGFTALFASTAMLTQASVKRCLAFSTVAQMGFMMLECGLGAFHLALLHLVAHSLYKAHAFLSSGGAAASRAKASQKAQSPWVVLGCMAAAMALCGLTAQVMGVDLRESPALNLIFCGALAQVLWSSGEGLAVRWRAPLGVAAGVGLSALYFLLERVAAVIVPPLPSAANAPGVWMAGLFLVAGAAQSQLPRLARTGVGERLYVHARNGFYCNTLANRMTSALWAPRLSKEGI